MYEGAVRISDSSMTSVSLEADVRLSNLSVNAFALIFLTICNCLVSDVVMIFLIGLLSERNVKLSEDGFMVRARRSGASVVTVV